MNMRLTEAEYRGLRSSPDRPIRVQLPDRDPAPGAARAKAPVTAGHAYQARATIKVGEEVVPRELRVTVLAIDDADGVYTAVIVAGDRTDEPRLLGKHGGYVHSLAAAMTGDLDPGEAVPEHVQRRWSQQAFERDELLRSQRIAKARAGVNALWSGGRDEKRAARVMEHHLRRLEAIDESEAA